MLSARRFGYHLVAPLETLERPREAGARELGAGSDLSDITVLIPARNEATCIPETLASLEKQGKDLAVVVVDDQSSDGTAEVAKGALPAICGSLSGEGIAGPLGRQALGTSARPGAGDHSD